MKNKRIVILTAILGLSAAGALGWYLIMSQATESKLSDKPALRPISMPKLIPFKFPMPDRPVANDTVFTFIADGKNAEAIARFEKEGVSINVLQPKTYYTPYVVAAKNCNAEMVRYLDRHNADMNIEVSSGNPVLISAYLNAAIVGCLPVIRYLVEEKKIDINATSKVWKETALYKAADGHYTELARYLLEKGIDRSVRDINGKTALAVAQEKGFTDIVSLIETFPK